VARDVVAPGTPALAAIVARFGSSILRPGGSLDRAALAGIVFADVAARRDLEQIVHPAVYEVMEVWFDRQTRNVGDAGLAIADVPLLFETGQQDRFHRVVVAACSPEQQLERLMARDGMTEEAARQRIAAQWPIEDKRARADMVIDTSGTIDTTIANVDRVWAALMSGA